MLITLLFSVFCSLTLASSEIPLGPVVTVTREAPQTWLSDQPSRFSLLIENESDIAVDSSLLKAIQRDKFRSSRISVFTQATKETAKSLLAPALTTHIWIRQKNDRIELRTQFRRIEYRYEGDLEYRPQVVWFTEDTSTIENKKVHRKLAQALRKVTSRYKEQFEKQAQEKRRTTKKKPDPIRAQTHGLETETVIPPKRSFSFGVVAGAPSVVNLMGEYQSGNTHGRISGVYLTSEHRGLQAQFGHLLDGDGIFKHGPYLMFVLRNSRKVENPILRIETGGNRVVATVDSLKPFAGLGYEFRIGPFGVAVNYAFPLSEAQQPVVYGQISYTVWTL